MIISSVGESMPSCPIPLQARLYQWTLGPYGNRFSWVLVSPALLRSLCIVTLRVHELAPTNRHLFFHSLNQNILIVYYVLDIVVISRVMTVRKAVILPANRVLNSNSR